MTRKARRLSLRGLTTFRDTRNLTPAARTIALMLIVFMFYGAAHAIEPNMMDVIVIDGCIEDWRPLNLCEIQLTVYSDTTFTAKSEYAADLSARFQTFADSSNVYIAVAVEDDRLCFGTEHFGWGWNDDAVEICFDGDLVDTGKPYFDANDGQIVIVPTRPDTLRLEGITPGFYITQIPFYWEMRGVTAAWAKSTKGYAVEVKLPYDLLGRATGNDEVKIGMNVRVFDEDNEGGDTAIEGSVKWAEDRNNTGFWRTESYRAIEYSRENGTIRENITVVDAVMKPYSLGLSSTPEDIALFNRMARSLEGWRWDNAAQYVDSLSSGSMKAILRGVIDLHREQYKEGIAMLNTISMHAYDAGDRELSRWASEYPLMLVREIGFSNELIYQISEKPIAGALLIIYFATKAGLKDDSAASLYANMLQKLGGSPKDFSALEIIIGDPIDDAARIKAVIALARWHFLNGNIDLCSSVCENLLSQPLEANDELAVKSLLYSLNEINGVTCRKHE